MIMMVKICLNLQNSKNRNIYIQMSLIISVFIKQNCFQFDFETLNLKLYYIENKNISLLF